MAKIVLDTVTGGYDLSVINNNFDKIELALQNEVLYRNNPVGEPNTLETDLDTNTKRIYNLPAPLTSSEAARLQDVQNALAGGAANLIGFTPYGTVTSTNVQAAVQELIDDTTVTNVSLPTFLRDSSAIVVSTITDLKAIDHTKFTKAMVFGYYTKSDGGGGFYWYDSTDTTSADNGGTIIVATDGGRWKLQSVGYLSVKQFGAKGDGTTDDTARIQAAITATSGTVFFPSGTYKTTATLLIASTTQLVGEGMQSTKILGATNNAKLLNFSAQWGGFRDLTLGYSVTPISGAVAVYSTSANLRASSFHITSCYDGIEITTGPAQYFCDFFIDNYVSKGIHAHEINDCYFEHFILDAKNATNGALGGIRLFNKAEAMIFVSGSVLNGVYGLTTDAASYTQGVRPAYNKFIGVYFDSPAQGVNLDKLIETQFSGCWFSGGRTGGGFPGCSLVQTDSVSFVAGCNFFNCGSHGLSIGAVSSRTMVDACFVDSNSITAGAGAAHGIFVAANANDFTLTNNVSRNGLYAGGQQGYGIYVSAGTSARYIIKNNNLAGNATGGLSDGGTGALSRVADNVGYNPVGMSAITVGASPFTYFSGNTRETIYVTGGTVSGINLPGGAIYGAGTDRSVTLEAGEQVTVFYTGVPTMWKYRH